jgi:hypothetical protein
VTTEVTCPTCGTVTVLDDVDRDAGAFCRVCDYPLFWTRGASTGQGVGGLDDDYGLRRLPGTGGMVAIATIDCWNCHEHNPVTGTYCIRCGVDLHPALVMPPPPPPPPPGPPPPRVDSELLPLPPRSRWAWLPAALFAAVLLAWCLVGLGWVLNH